MSVGRMLREMNSRELSEWAAYFSLENKPKKQPVDDETITKQVRTMFSLMPKKDK